MGADLPKKNNDTTNNGKIYAVSQFGYYKLIQDSASNSFSDVGQKDQVLITRKQEVAALEEQLNQIKPTVADLKNNRLDVENEYRNITDKRNSVILELSQVFLWNKQ